MILIIFPLYPACSLLVELLRTALAFRRTGWRDSKFLLSRISGLRVVRPDGLSETLDSRHLGRYSCVKKQRRMATIVQACILILVSFQCLGTLVRTISRLYVSPYGRHPNMDAFLIEVRDESVLKTPRPNAPGEVVSDVC